MTPEAVDILIAIYNGAPFVAEQLDSILAQTYPHIRLLIRDDGSSDDSVQIVESYVKRHPSKVFLLPGGKRLGVRGNFSQLMGDSTASYIMFADQDDVWTPEKVEKTFYKMKRLESQFSTATPLLVHTDLTVVDQQLRQLSPSFWKYANIRPLNTDSLNRLLVQPAVTGCTVMINRALLKHAWPIPADCVMHDAWLTLVAAVFGKVEALPLSTVLYRQHQANALGAYNFLSWKYLKQATKKLSLSEKAKFAQADQLLSRYHASLDPNQIQLITAFLALVNASFPMRAYLILKYRLFRAGFLRNLAALFASGLYHFNRINRI